MDDSVTPLMAEHQLGRGFNFVLSFRSSTITDILSINLLKSSGDTLFHSSCTTTLISVADVEIVGVKCGVGKVREEQRKKAQWARVIEAIRK